MLIRLISLNLLFLTVTIGHSQNLEELGLSNEYFDATNFSRYQSNKNIKQDEDYFNSLKGYSARDYYSSDGFDFVGRTSNFVGGTVSGMGDRTCLASSTEPFLDHEIVMDRNDVLLGISYWVNDTDIDDNLHVYIYESCLPSYSAAAISSRFHLIDELQTSAGNYSRFILLNKSYRGNYDSCKMMARIKFGTSAVNCAQAPDIIFQKFRVIIRNDDLIFANGLDLY